MFMVVKFLTVCLLIDGVISQCLLDDADFAVCEAQGYRSVPNHFNSAIKLLILPKNNIAKLTADILTLYPEVTEFNLDQNLLKSTTNLRAVSVMKMLKILHMSENDLVMFDFGVFYKNIRLEEIYIDRNPRIFIKENPANLRSLKKVSLINNKLRDLPLRALSGFSKLEILDLRNNELKMVPASTLEVLSNLKRLLIANNDIINLDYALISKTDLVSGRRMPITTTLSNPSEHSNEVTILQTDGLVIGAVTQSYVDAGLNQDSRNVTDNIITDAEQDIPNVEVTISKEVGDRSEAVFKQEATNFKQAPNIEINGDSNTLSAKPTEFPKISSSFTVNTETLFSALYVLAILNTILGAIFAFLLVVLCVITRRRNKQNYLVEN